MANLPYMPLYIDDFEAATTHLTIEEDGIYNRLLRLCWRTPGCSIPMDPAWIARRMRMPDQFNKIKPILDEFFKIKNNRYFQKKQSKIFSSKTFEILARKEAGKRGGLAKSLKYKEKDPGKAKDLLEQNPSKALASRTRTIKKNSTPPKPPSRGPRTDKSKKGSRWEEKPLPKEYRVYALEKYEDWNNDVIDLVFESFQDYWLSVAGAKGLKLDWLATWRSWCRNEYHKYQTFKGKMPEKSKASEIIKRMRKDEA